MSKNIIKPRRTGPASTEKRRLGAFNVAAYDDTQILDQSSRLPGAANWARIGSVSPQNINPPIPGGDPDMPQGAIYIPPGQTRFEFALKPVGEVMHALLSLSCIAVNATLQDDGTLAIVNGVDWGSVGLWMPPEVTTVEATLTDVVTGTDARGTSVLGWYQNGGLHLHQFDATNPVRVGGRVLRMLSYWQVVLPTCDVLAMTTDDIELVLARNKRGG